MNKSEIKYFNTARAMDEALLSLLEKKEFEYISIKEVCEKAGVNRSTFYLHYDNLSNLLEETLEYVNTELLSAFSISPDKFLNGIEKSELKNLVLINDEYLTPYLSFVKEHRNVFAAAYRNPKCLGNDGHVKNISRYVLNPIMDRFQIPKEEQKYWTNFYIHGTMAIVNEWIIGGCKESIEDIAKIIIHCVRPHNAENNKKFGE